MALQWVLIEASTLFGALLISMSQTEKSMSVAWKFLLLNSFGLSISFLGLIILSYGIGDNISLNAHQMIPAISSNQNKLVEIGMWLVVFGYSVKLGLVPNHFWVSDTYAESPSQVSSLLASFIPTTVCIALRPIIKMDALFTDKHFSSANALLVLGILTMFYSLWTLYQSKDIRRITAQIALFHSGALAVFLWLDVSNEIFYFGLCGTLVVKAFLFSSLGVFRLDATSRDLDEIEKEESLALWPRVIYLTAIAFSFILPFSPVILSDLIVIKYGLEKNNYYVVLVPILAMVCFAVCLYRFLPLFNIPARLPVEDKRQAINARLFFSLLLLVLSFIIGIYGLLFAASGFESFLFIQGIGG
jgi:hydrogenase-4 component F